MSGISLNDAKDAKQEAQDDGLRDNDAGIPDAHAFDYEEFDAPIVRGHPEVVVAFDRIVGFSPFNTDDSFLQNQNNLELAGPRNYGNDVVLTVENPTLVDGELWVEDNDFRDYRVVGDVTAEYSPYSQDSEIIGDPTDPDGVNVQGVNLGMGGFEGERADEQAFDSRYVQFFISSRRAASLLGQLDTAGKWAFTQDGEFTEGIIEAPPMLGEDDYDTEAHGAPRAIGYPELRQDMVDQSGAIAWTFGDDEPTTQSPVDVTILKVEDNEIVGACAPLSPEDDAYAKPTYPRRGNVYYEHAEGTSATDTDLDTGADADPETDEGVAEATAMAGAFDQTDNSDDEMELAYQDLPDAVQNFVDNGVEQVTMRDLDSITEFDMWDAAFAEGMEDVDFEIDQDHVAEIIDSRV